jgi:sigma-B regulation protein RsbU (phosphoserine phosphatase)
LADVSGKGISAALYTTTVQTALRIYAESSNDPAKLLTKIDEHLHGRMKRQYFLTMVLVCVTKSGAVSIARAGHPRPVLVSARDGAVRSIDAPGVAIGMGIPEPASKRSPGRRYANVRTRLSVGDVLVCVSDGVLETSNRDGEEYGDARLHALLQLCRSESAELIKERLIADLREFRRGQDLRDDSTFIVVKRTV